MTTTVNKNASIAWNVSFTTFQARQVLWDTLHVVTVPPKSTAWHLFGGVNVTKNTAWVLRQQVNKKADVRYNDLAHVSTEALTEWAVLKAVSQLKNIAWHLGINPNGPVVKTANAWFNTHGLVNKQASVAWNMAGHMNMLRNVNFNTLSSVDKTAETAWVIGSWVDSHIRQLAQERIDFIY